MTSVVRQGQVQYIQLIDPRCSNAEVSLKNMFNLEIKAYAYDV